jgi:hypothetical protein
MKIARYIANENGRCEGLPAAASRDGVVLHEDFAAVVRENRELRKQLKKRSPRKLYMIRLENGNSVILQAESQDDAIDFAGINVTPEDVTRVRSGGGRERVATTPEELAELQYQLMQTGVGAQRYTIRELKRFFCEVDLLDDGQFDLNITSEEAEHEFERDYPKLIKAQNEAGDLALKGGWEMYPIREGETLPRRKRSPREIELISEGVQKERTRLAARME